MAVHGDDEADTDSETDVGGGVKTQEDVYGNFIGMKSIL